MVVEQNDEWIGTPISKENIFNLIVINVCKFFSEITSPRSKALLKISAAIDFIERNFDKPISNVMLANKANIPEGSFRYSFKRITGLSPIDYLIRLRIEKAADMMAENNRMRVIDAAFNSGFENSAYFTRKFKEIIGMTPMNYLKKQRTMIE
jgi:transcriptional regulator GlxA family with amidase domain